MFTWMKRKRKSKGGEKTEYLMCFHKYLHNGDIRKKKKTFGTRIEDLKDASTFSRTNIIIYLTLFRLLSHTHTHARKVFVFHVSTQPPPSSANEWISIIWLPLKAYFKYPSCESSLILAFLFCWFMGNKWRLLAWIIWNDSEWYSLLLLYWVLFTSHLHP